MSAPAGPLAYEAAARRWVVPAAAVAGALPIVSTMVGAALPGPDPQNRPSAAVYTSDHAAVLTLSSSLRAIAFVAMAVVLAHLWRATRARREGLHPMARLAAVVGCAGVGVTTILFQIVVDGKAVDFAGQGGQTWQEAYDMYRSGAVVAFTYLGLPLALMMIVGFALVSLNAMRVGLLTQVMGYIGVFAGVMAVLPVQSAPLIASFWLIALAYLLSGRWPKGVPPAWSTGRAEPWPTLARQRESAARSGGAAGGRSGGGSGGAGGRDGGQAPPPRRPAGGSAAPASARRKRKKRS